MRSRIYRITSYLAILLAAGSPLTLSAHDPITTQVTWDREIYRLLSAKCASCHREGGAAFSLMTYDDARPWAKAIKEETLERRMPPFGAVKGFADLQDDQSLTQEQLELIADWVEGGAPEGDPAWLPDKKELPGVPSGPQIAAPPAGAETIVEEGTVLSRGVTVFAVAAKEVADGGSLRAFARQPDGSVIPLLWVYQYNPKFQRVYYFRQPFTLSAGTRILMSKGELSLLSPGGKH